MKIALLKNDKKSQKRCKPPKKALHIERQEKNIEKRERKTKNERKSNSENKYFFPFTFLKGRIYILLENIFGKT